jgi:hypothetical protein
LETGALAIRATGLQQKTATSRLLGLAMRSVFAAKAAVLVELQLVRRVPFILRSSVVALLTLGAGKRHDIPHDKILASPRPYKEEELVANLINKSITR